MQTIPNQATVVTNSAPMMSSREIAKLTKKLSKNVIRDVWEILEQLYHINKDGSDLSHYKNQQVRLIEGVNAAIDARGYVSEFLLDRRHTEILITGYDIKRRAAVIDRWFTLESNEVKAPALLPDFNNPALAARAWADEVEQKQKLLIENQELAPKAQFHDAVVVTDDAISIANAAKALNTGRNRLCSFMRKNGWMTRHNEPYQAKIEAGLLDVKINKYMHPENGLQQSLTTLVTGKGLTKLQGLLQGGIQ